jgi:Tfp pilus assembly protein PilE
MKIDSSTQKVSTHATRNIIFTLLCFPPIFLNFRYAAAFIILHPYKSPVIWFAVICPLALGIIIAILCARRIKQRLASGDSQGAEKIYKKSKKGFLVAVIVIWAIGAYAAFSLPAFGYFTVGNMNANAKSTLEEIAKIQDTYHDNHGMYTNNLKDLNYIGWPHGIKVQIHEATHDCWVATAGYKRGPFKYIFTYDHCGGGLQENKP